MQTWRHLTRPDSLVALVGIAIAAYVIASPFFLATYPPITDLPFHAANTSVLRNYFDSAYHFREQFLIEPLEAPYMLMYALGALFALFLPIATAMKCVAVVMLSLLPLGLAVLFRGMKKSPLLGLLGLGLVWTTLTHWGFLSFIGAVGLFAMSIGTTLMVLDRPTRGRQVALAASLLAVFFTHIYRFPFAALSVGLTVAVMFPATRRYKPVLAAALPSVLLFATFLLVRSHIFTLESGHLTFEFGRLSEIPGHVFGAFAGEVGERERGIGTQVVLAAVLAGAGLFALRRSSGSGSDVSPPRRLWERSVTLLALLLSLGFLLAFLTLPMMLKSWFFVYPREAMTALYILLAVAPDLPRSVPVRLAFVALVSVGPLRFASLVGDQWRDFERATADFRQIKELVPAAPRLLYLIYDHSDTARSTTPFIHLPAWIQAETGGWLYFHFVRWGLYPIRYDFDGGAVPPTLPHMLEWEPHRFNVTEHGPWFDTFLVRHRIDPKPVLAADPELELTANVGKWWLYRRR